MDIIKTIDKIEDLELLYTKCTDIIKITPAETKIIKNMKTILEKDGLGIAANQIGSDKRIVAILKDIQEDEKGKITCKKPLEIIIMINPEFKKLSNKTIEKTEACLSINLEEKERDKEQENNLVVKRYKAIEISYLDENLKPQRLKAYDLCARVVQHEIDHLNGKLYIDYNLKAYKEKVLPNKTKAILDLYKLKQFSQISKELEDNFLDKANEISLK